MGKAIYLYTYKELERVPLIEIHAKYAPKNITIERLYQRIVKSGMSIERALTTPLGTKDKKPPHRRVIEAEYNRLCISYKNAVSLLTFTNRIRDGISVDKSLIKKRNVGRRFKIKVNETPELLEAIEELRKEKTKSKHKGYTVKEIDASNEDNFLADLMKIPKSLQLYGC